MLITDTKSMIPLTNGIYLTYNRTVVKESNELKKILGAISTKASK